MAANSRGKGGTRAERLWSKRARRRGAWARLAASVAGPLVAAGFLRHAGIPSVGALFALAFAAAAAWKVAEFDPAAQAGPGARRVHTADLLLAAGLTLGLYGLPTGATGVPVARTVLFWLVDGGIAASIGVAVTRRLGRAEPGVSRAALLLDAWATGWQGDRTRTCLVAVGGVALGVGLAAGGVPGSGLLAALVCLAPARLRLPEARVRDRVAADVSAALAGLFRGGAWTTPMEQAARAPVTVHVSADGIPERVILPLPQGFSASGQDTATAEIEARLASWGTWAVRYDTGAARTAVADRVPPLPAALRFDGRAAKGGTVVWLGVGLATREHATAPGTPGAPPRRPLRFHLGFAP